MRRQKRSLWQRYAFAGGPRFLALGDALVVGALSIAAFAHAGPSASATTAQPRELVELRTEHSRTLDNGDGTRTTTTSVLPLHFRSDDGRLRPIATRLAPHGAASVINQADELRAAFNRRAGRDFVRIERGDDRFGLTLEGARPVPARIAGSTIRYPGIARDATLEYQTRPGAVKETVVLNSASAPASYRFRLRQPPGQTLQPRRNVDGSWSLAGSRGGAAAFTIEAPWAVDAKGKGRGNSGATLDIRRDGDDLLLDLSVDRAWLSAPERAFPVRLDPSIALGLPTNFAAFRGDCGTCVGHQYYDLRIGASATEVWRNALEFNFGVPADSTVTAAHLTLRTGGTCLSGTGTSCHGSSHTFTVHRILNGWTHHSRSMDVNHDPTVLATDTLPATSASETLEWDITALARDWHRGTKANYGVLLRRSGEQYGAGGISPTYYDARVDVTYQPDRVELYEPQVLNRTGATLRWSRAATAGFTGYEVHRGATPGFTTTTATRLATITEIGEQTYRDDSARPGTTVYYKVVAAGMPSNEQQAILPGETQPARSILQPRPDDLEATTILEQPPTGAGCTNQSHEQLLQGTSLLRWNLGSIPPDSKVASARLSLHRYTHTASAASYELRPIAREWRESRRANCVADGATWEEAFAGVPWETPGGDTDGAAISSTVAAGSAPGWQEWDVTALVREWVTGDRTNHGVKITGGQFLSEDNTLSPALRPKLEITYEDPEPVGIPTVALVTPRDGERVRDTIAVAATAGDDRRVDRVEFLLDGTEFAEDATAPYSVNLDTRAYANGSHTFRARAVDDAGNAGQSEIATVSVANFARPGVALVTPAADYPGAVKADAPAGYWRLGETSGSVAADASGNGRNGSYTPVFVLNQPSLLTGDANPSARLRAPYANVSASGFSGLLGGSFTAEAWIKHPGLTATGDTDLVSRDFNLVGGWTLGVQRVSSGYQLAVFSVRTGSGVVTTSSMIAPSPTNPPTYHLVGTFGGGQIRLFVDGQTNGSTSAALQPSAGSFIVLGQRKGADLDIDDASVYPTALSAQQVRAHHELGRGRPFPVSGQQELRATASAAPGRSVREVQFLVDEVLVGRDDTQPYAVTWDTAAGAVPDGRHEVTARVVDDHDRESATAPVAVQVSNLVSSGFPRAELTAATALPETLVHGSGATGAAVGVRVKNTGDTTITSGSAVLRYRWQRPDGTFDDSVASNVSLGGALAPGAERTLNVTVEPPALPSGMSRSRMTLRFDLRDTSSPYTWWAARGNAPLEHSVLIQRQAEVGLGLERYYHYDGEELGGGMSQLVNLASGNNIVRFTPFVSPGRGLSTVLDMTYNSAAGESKGSPLGAGWSLALSSLSPFGEPLRCGSSSSSELMPKRCEEYALEGGSDKTGLAMDLVDGDGTVHRFTGRRTAGRTFWRAPQGIHLYLRQLEADEQPACNVVESGMAYTTYQPAIGALWAFTRPDGSTFYYQRNGWPTGVADRNGNCIDIELSVPHGKQDRVRVTEVVDAAGVANAAIRDRRAFKLTYYEAHHGGDDDEGDDDARFALGDDDDDGDDAPKVKSIRDHTGSLLRFEYYKDDRLKRVLQDGGTTPEGLSAPTRSWVLTYTDWGDDDDEESFANIASAAAREHPDEEIHDNGNLLYSVRDPRGRETRFDYYGRWPHAGKASRLKRRTNRAGEVTTFAYDTGTRTTTVERPLDRDSRYVFDVEGSPTALTDAVTATTEETTAVSWTAERQVFKVTEPNGQFTEYAYDPNGYLTKRWDQLRRMTELQYEYLPVDDDDVVAGWVQPGRTVPHISQLTKRITPRGKQWIFDHDDATGNLRKLTDPEGFASRFEYNADGTTSKSLDGLDDDGTATPPKAAGEPDRITSFDAYDANGLPTKVTDPVGAVSYFCHDDDGLLRWSQDARHAALDKPTDWSQCVTHPGRGHRSYFDYDPLHRMARTSEPKLTGDPDSFLLWTHARFDDNDNVVEHFGAQHGATFQPGAGSRTLTAYDAMDRTTSETLFDYDSAYVGGDLTDTEREERTELAYDGAGRVSRITSPRGVSTPAAGDYAVDYAYDRLDRIVVRTANSGTSTRATSYCFDNAGEMRSVTRPRDAAIAVTCGAAGAAAGTPYTTRHEYTAAHELRKSIEPSGDEATQTYDLDGNAAEATDAEGAKTNWTYDDRGLVTQVAEDFETDSTPRRITTKVAYDAVGNVKHTYSPRAVEAANGNPGPNSDFVATNEYDGLDRAVRELLPKAGSEPRRYIHRRFDANGNLTHVTVPVTENSLGTILADPAEKKKWVTENEHFDPGWIRSSVDQSPKVVFDYTAEGWQSERSPARESANIRDTSRTYYRDGLLRTFRDERRQPTLRRYDRNGNLTFVRDSGVSSSRKPLTLDIDHNGFDEVSSTISTEEDRDVKTTDYTYWSDGLLKTRADDREESQGGTLIRAARRHEFSYDADGQPTVHLDLGRSSGPDDDKRITQTWFPTGRENQRTVEQYGSGAFTVRQVTQREYFANGLPRKLRTYGGTVDPARLRESHTTAYRDSEGVYVNGNRTRDEFFRDSPKASAPCKTAGSACTQRWVYDGADRLIEENNGRGERTGYRLRASGGIAEKYDADNPSQVRFAATFIGQRMQTVTQSGATARLHYDDDGNTTCMTTEDGTAADDCDRTGDDASPKLIEDYAYDYRNRLTGTSRPDMDRRVTYEHDAIDRPVGQVERKGSVSTTHELSYVGATTDVAEERESGPRDSTRSYSYDAFGRRVGLSIKRGSDSTRELTYAQDLHGSISMLLSETGATKASYGYTAYGETDAALTGEQLPGSAQEPDPEERVNPFRYSGKRGSSDDTIDMGARQFGPGLAQFLQEDRYDDALADLSLATDPLTANRFSLAGGNPISFVEVDGHVPRFESGEEARAVNAQRVKALAKKQAEEDQAEPKTAAPTPASSPSSGSGSGSSGTGTGTGGTSRSAPDKPEPGKAPAFSIPFTGTPLSNSSDAFTVGGPAVTAGGMSLAQTAEARLRAAQRRRQRIPTVRTLPEITESYERSIGRQEAAAKQTASRATRITRFGGRALPLVGAGLQYSANKQGGDSTARAAVKTGFAAGGAAIGVAAGGACVVGAPACSFVLGTLGGFAGNAIGGVAYDGAAKVFGAIGKAF